MNTVIAQKAVILNSKNEVLLLRRSEKCSRPGGWDLPGGGLEFGEDPLQGMKREIFEETGLTATAVHPVFVTSTIEKDGQFEVLIGYLATISETSVSLSWEHDEYQWMEPFQTTTIELPTAYRDIIDIATTQ